MKTVLVKLLSVLITATLLLQIGVTAFASAGAEDGAEQPKAVGSVADDIYGKAEDYVKKFAGSKIKAAIGKIPVVGGTVKSLFGSYIDDLLGIKKEESVSSKLDKISAKLETIIEKMESNTQDELEKIYEQQFGTYEALLSSVESATKDYVEAIDETASGEDTDDDKTEQIAYLTKLDGFEDYYKDIVKLSQYVIGSTVNVHSTDGVYAKAFNIYCYDARKADGFAFGGEAAMLAADYVNTFNEILDSAQTTVAMMLLARSKTESDNYNSISDDNKTAKNEAKGVLNLYKSKYDNIRYLHYDIFGATKEDVANEKTITPQGSTCPVKVKPGVVGDYNTMLADRWFDVIYDVNFRESTNIVSFFNVDSEIGFNTLEGYGLDKTYAASLEASGAETYLKTITSRVLADKRAALSDEWLDKLLKHIKTSEFFKAAGGKKTVSLRDALEGFGFSFSEYDAFLAANPDLQTILVTDATCKREHYVPQGQVAVTELYSYVHGIDCTAKTADINGTSSGKKHQYFSGRYSGSKTTDTDFPDVIMLSFKNTIEINSADAFTEFLGSIAGGENYAGKTVALNCDVKLDLDSYDDVWDNDHRKKEFCGSFDGRGHTVSGLTLKNDEHRLGLFRSTGDSAEIKNLVLDNIIIENTTKSEACAALVGYANGNLTVENVTVTKNCRVTGFKYAGGIVGETKEGKHVKVTLNECTNEADIASADADAGGLLGNGAEVYINLCVNNGKVTANKGAAGGIVGYIGNCDNDPPVKAEFCTNNGNIVGYDCAGGIIGHLYSDASGVEIFHNSNAGDITVTGKHSAGGIIGRNCSVSEFTENENSGNILNKSKEDSAYAGGILGDNEDDRITLLRNKNSGSVSAYARAGGIAGTLGDRDHDKVCTVFNNQNSGKITSTAKDAGGIIGAIATDSTSHAVGANINTGAVTACRAAGGVIGWMAGGGRFEKNTNSASVISNELNAGGIVGCIQDDTCTFSRSDVGSPVVGVGSEVDESGYCIVSETEGQHAAKICGWDGKKKKVINSDDLLASVIGSGSAAVIAVLSVAVVAAAVIFAVVFKKKKKAK